MLLGVRSLPAGEGPQPGGDEVASPLALPVLECVETPAERHSAVGREAQKVGFNPGWAGSSAPTRKPDPDLNR